MRKGRELEILVEHIKMLQLPNASIQSPEWVTDRDTGTRREVDVGIRQKRGDHEIFIAIECRDKKEIQNIQWIEQLIAKKESIGAHVLFAVASSDFTKPAILKAQKRGVFLRRMVEKLPEEIVNLSNSIYVTFEYIKPVNVKVDLAVLPCLQKDLSEYMYKHEFVERELTYSELCSLLITPQEFHHIVSKFRELGPDSFEKYDRVRHELVIPEIFIIMENERLPVFGARLDCHIIHEELSLPIIALQEYTPVGECANDDRATMFTFGSKKSTLSKITLDHKENNVLLEIFAKQLLLEGKFLIGWKVEAQEPITISWLRLDL